MNSILKTLFGCSAALVLLNACSGNSQDMSTDSSSQASAQAVSDTAINLAIQAPVVAVVGKDVNFRFQLPPGLNFSSAQWDFGDGNRSSVNVLANPHAYRRTGLFNVSLSVLLQDGRTVTAMTEINIVEARDGQACLGELNVDVPKRVKATEPAKMNIEIPNCLNADVTTITWDTGDSTPIAFGDSIQHAYAFPGAFTVTIEVHARFMDDGQPWLTLHRQVRVSAPTPVPTPTPSPTSVATPTPNTDATPTATPCCGATPTPVATPVATPAASPTATPCCGSATPTPTPAPSPTCTPPPPPCCGPVATPAATPTPSPTPVPAATPQVVKIQGGWNLIPTGAYCAGFTGIGGRVDCVNYQALCSGSANCPYDGAVATCGFTYFQGPMDYRLDPNRWEWFAENMDHLPRGWNCAVQGQRFDGEYAAMNKAVFDARFYLDTYADVRAATGNDPGLAAQHWLNYGMGEGRLGNPNFSAKAYLDHNPDVSAAYGAGNLTGAAEHYLRFGRSEGRGGL